MGVISGIGNAAVTFFINLRKGSLVGLRPVAVVGLVVGAREAEAELGGSEVEISVVGNFQSRHCLAE